MMRNSSFGHNFLESEWLFLRYLNKGNFADSLFAIDIALEVGFGWGNVIIWLTLGEMLSLI